jgi:hypothetical protein
VDAPDPLLSEIATLLDAPVDHDDPDRLERTLTDGYARALNLEAEKWRLQRQMGEISSVADRDLSKDLVALAKRLEAQDDGLVRLRALLVRLRERYSLATRVAAASRVEQHL